MTKQFDGNRKSEPWILASLEKKFIDKLIPYFSSFFETYELTWLTLLWSLLIVLFSYLARVNIYYLLFVSLAILLHYITDLFDGAVGRKKKTGLIRWGYFMDHFFDFIFLCSVIIGYSFLLPKDSSFLSLIFLSIFTGFMINSFLEFSATGEVNISYFGIGPTEIRCMFILFNFFLILFGRDVFSVSLPFIVFFSGIALCITVYITQKKLWEIDMQKRKTPVFLLFRRTLTMKYSQFKLKYFLFISTIVFLSINLYVYLTNPFNFGTIIKNPFYTSVVNGEVVLHKNFSLNVESNIFQKLFAYYKAGMHIIADVYFGGSPAKSTTVNGIIAEIHTLRFDPSKPYLISGDQFSVLYPRNPGVFYYSLLDPRTAYNQTDWLNRQRIYIQTIAYILDTFSTTHELSTTIVPIGIHTVIPVTIYAYPSDSLYGIVYGLDLLENARYLENLYPTSFKSIYTLRTQETAHYLLYTYKDDLRSLLQEYINTVYDANTGLIRKDITLASARDSVKRSSAFYDNVIFWRTLQLASSLGLQQYDPKYLEQLKQKILTIYWDPEEGHFRDDIKNDAYSSDWLIVLPTGFLSINNTSDRYYLEESAIYSMKNNLDTPFGIKYQTTHTAEEVGLVKYIVPSYGTDAIWSFWGTEYSKLLILLYQTTGKKVYRDHAEHTLQAYTKNILLYKGFPEVYTSQGKFLETPFYKSIRQTGWVVNYEEAMLMLKNSEK